MKNKKLILPITALCLSLLPILVFIISLFGLAGGFGGFATFALLPALLAPIIGLVTGVIYLSKVKEQKCKLGKIFAITAICIPLSVVAFVVVFFIGAVTGIIPLM